jgi:hypothetical protein
VRTPGWKSRSNRATATKLDWCVVSAAVQTSVIQYRVYRPGGKPIGTFTTLASAWLACNEATSRYQVACYVSPINVLVDLDA